LAPLPECGRRPADRFNISVGERRTTLFLDGAVVRVADVSCRAPRSPRGGEEWSGEAQLVVPRQGVFVLHRRRGTSVVDTNTAVLFGPGECYRVSHPAAGGDECTVFVFARDVLEDALGGQRGRIGAVEPATQLAVHVLRRALADGAVSSLDAEDAALLLLEALAGRLAPETFTTDARLGPGPRRRIEEARALLASRPSAHWRIRALASAVHSSPYHLARQFRVATGETVSRYLLRLRLGLALERMGEGETDLAGLAVELGFAHQSHFGARFRSIFGTTPGAARETLTRARLPEMRTIVTAGSPAAAYARGHGDPRVRRDAARPGAGGPRAFRRTR
jgi:AraC family transcriptional regulator